MTHRYRITFSKGSELRFTGHLDLHRAWERTFRRAEIPLAYSEGYKPRPKINIGAALPLGCTSEQDLVDVELAEAIGAEGLLDMLSGVAPPGLIPVGVEGIQKTAPKLQVRIRASEYVVSFPKELSSQLAPRIEALLAATEVTRTRRGKTYDLRPLIEDLGLRETGEATELQMRLTARSGATGRPDEVLAALELDPRGLVPHRVRLLLDK